MTIQELKNKILAKGWYFRFLSPNPQNKSDFGWKTLAEVDGAYGGFESYLNKIAESQKLKELNINTKAKNGSSFLNTGTFLVNIVPVENIESGIGNVEVNKKPEPIKSTQNFDNTESHKVTETTNSTPTPKMEDLKTHIENASMKTELMFLKERNTELTDRNKKLDQKNEELFSEVSKLSRELSTIGAKYDLDYQKKGLELAETNKPKGLGAIVDEIKNLDPKTLALGISIFQPNNPAVKAMLGEGNEGSEINTALSGAKHEDTDTQDYIENVIYPMLTSAPSGAVGMIGGLVEYFMKFPDHLAMTYTKWLGTVKAKTTGAVTETNEEDPDEKQNN